MCFQKRIICLFYGKNICTQYAENFKSMQSLKRNLVILKTETYISKNMDYGKCCNYLFSKAYFGNGIYGFNNASEFYYKKNYRELNDKDSYVYVFFLGILYSMILQSIKNAAKKRRKKYI